ncbi:MAG TPA: hypothetical protein VGO96_13205 [Pyrinomonadaceae bacterium]|nr:hypothetical protein [Pyrinomonadaceae bacterium]
MRRKLGILLLVGVTVLAGTQEAMRQFDGLRSSLKDLTRASLWSGLIVYAQPVSDGKLPAPQIYYLTPQPQTSPASTQEPVLADNRNAAAAEKPEAKNNHSADELALASNADMMPPAPPAREVEDAAKSELVLDKMASHVVVASQQLAANARKLEKVRVYEEVASNVSGARRFRREANVIAREFVKEFDAAKLEAELTRLAAAHEQLETSKLKSFADAEAVVRRFELKAIRRAPRPERPERIKLIAPYADRRAILLPEISSIGCEPATNALASAGVAEAPFIETTVVAAGMAASVMLASEPVVAVEVGAAPVAAPLAPSTSWALGCDTEPEFAK